MQKLIRFVLVICVSFFLPCYLLAAVGDIANKAEWPVEADSPHGKIVIYQPQAEKFENDILSGRTAVSVTLKK